MIYENGIGLLAFVCFLLSAFTFLFNLIYVSIIYEKRVVCFF